MSDAHRPGTTVLAGAVAVAVADLKTSPGKDLLVIASSGPARSLARHDLVDEYRLW